MVACHNCLPLQLAQLQCNGGLSLSLGRFPLSVYVFLEERKGECMFDGFKVRPGLDLLSPIISQISVSLDLANF